MKEVDYKRQLNRCVRCGSCKALCPTYMEELDETMGARGRLYILQAIEEKRLEPTTRASDKLFSCIQCGACSTLCPTGIDVAEAIYHGRTILRKENRKRRFIGSLSRSSIKRIGLATSILRPIQKLLYPALLRKGIVNPIPEIAPVPFRERFKVYKEGGKRIGRIAIFVGCSINYLYPSLGESLLRVLLRLGYEVVVLKGEVCCGAPLRTFGFEEDAIKMAEKNIEVFEKVRAEAVVTMCPTCAVMLKMHYPELLGKGIDNVLDINQFLIDRLPEAKVSKRVVTYFDPCHLRYGLNVTEEPRRILKAIDGIEYREMKNPPACCGFGGFFSINFRGLSNRIGDKLAGYISQTGPHVLATSCPGCMMHIEGALQRIGSERRTKKSKDLLETPIEVMHMVEVIEEAIC